MNDFTKEELQWLYGCVTTCEPCYDLAIGDKLQSLIDNYCDHKNTENISNCEKCIDCGDIWQ